MSNSKSNNSSYSVDNLIVDELFIRWVKFGKSEDNDRWTSLLDQHPDLQTAVAEARLWVEEISFETAEPTLPEETVFYNRLKNTIGYTDEQKVRRLPQWLRVAATLTAILVTLLLTYWAFAYYSFKRIATGDGEIARIILPDNSEVILNANTKVKYERTWGKDEPREIWIDGEGYFNVKHLNKDQNHIKNSERFIVHTADVNIRVLGTSFNVNTRRNKTKVVLTKGKIQLSLANDNKAPIVMVPGEAVTYSKEQKHVIKNKSLLNPSVSSAWKERKLIFVQSNIQQIADQIEDNLGYKVVVNAPSLNGRTISGSVATDNVDLLAKILADLLNVDVKVDSQNKKILIHDKN